MKLSACQCAADSCMPLAGPAERLLMIGQDVAAIVLLAVLVLPEAEAGAGVNCVARAC
jgi:hypothetical protein